PHQEGRLMFSIAIGDLAGGRIQPYQKKSNQRDRQVRAQKIMIKGNERGRRIATSRELQLDRGDQMRKPHRGRQTFAGDVSNREYQVIFKVKDTYEVAGKMAHREN